MKYAWLFGFGLGVSLLAGCSVPSQGGSQGDAVEKWSTFEQVDFDKPPEDNYHSRVIFVRDPADNSQAAVNVYVNNEYLTSLLPKGAKSLILCSGDNRLYSVYTNVNDRYLSKLERGETYRLPAGGVSYYIIEQKNAEILRFREIDASAFAGLDIKKQSHTLSRVDNKGKCAQ